MRARLRAGEPMIGLAACVLRSAEILVLARSAGFDWLLVDMEHTPVTIGEAGALATAGQAAGFPVLVRVGGPDHPDLARVLDCGAEGVVVPHVDSAAQARRIVGLCRFGPIGRRSLPSPLARFGFRMPPAGEMMRATEDATLVVAMIESASGLAEVDAIAAVPGLDALMVGANDLADGLGLTGCLDHPAVRDAFARVAAATSRHGLAFGVIGVPEDLLGPLAYDLGARLIVATNDVNLLLDAGTAMSNRLRAAIATSGH